MATVGQSLATPETGWVRYDNEDANIKYVGKWIQQGGNASFWDSTVKYTTTAGDLCQFNFTGTKLRLIGLPSANRSTSVDIFIDGLKVTTFSQYAGGYIWRALDADIQNLANEEHSVQIINNATGGYGGVYVLDAIDIDAVGTLKPYNDKPAVPVSTNLTATAGDFQVTLSWTAVEGVTSYNVKRSTTAGGPYTTIATNVSGTSYLDTTVTNGTYYYYVVNAVDSNGNESANSNEASATPVAAQVPTGQALLRVTMLDSSEREYRLTIAEIEGFISWYTRTIGTGISCYALNDIVDNSKEYLSFEKIISFKVIPLKD
jgi:hypothetical protein